MPTKAYIDSIENLTCQEKYGAVIRLERLVHVHGIDATTKDYFILIQALNEAGVPTYGSLLSTSLYEGTNNLYLAERNATVVDIDKVDVRLVYEVKWGSEGWTLNTVGAVNTGEVRANIQQISTNRDKDGNEVTVQHTFSSDDPDAGDYAGQTITQSGEFTVYTPQRTLQIRGLIANDEPWTIANAIVGYVNSTPFGSGGSSTGRDWLCTAATWKAYNIKSSGESGSDTYMFTFEFQHNPDGWDPSVVFINPKTGKPPVGLVANVGYKQIQWHPSCDFEEVLGFALQGG
jgi:hypothetical protein